MFGTSRPQKSCLPRRRFAPQGNLWSVALSPRSMVTSCVFIQAHGWKCHCNKGTGRCQWHSVECLWYCYIILLCVRKKHVDSIVCFVSFSVLPYVVMFATSSFGGNCNWLVAIYLSASEDGLKSVAVRYAWNWNVLVNTPEPSSCLVVSIFTSIDLHIQRPHVPMFAWDNARCLSQKTARLFSSTKCWPATSAVSLSWCSPLI